jgi:hypothetical protein
MRLGDLDTLKKSMCELCNQDCIANVCGECAAEKCEGQIQRLEGYHSAEKAAWAYKIAVDSFHDYFGNREAAHEQ